MTPPEEQNSKTTGRKTSRIGHAVTHSVLLAVCCFLSYKIITDLLAVSRFVPRDDEFLGGMWAVVATIFVFRYSYDESVHAALSRSSATLLSFVLCLVYLLIFPFRLWGLVVLIAIGAVVLELIARSEDIITAGITTTVVMVVAGISPEHAWKQPILRLIDSIVGIGVGILGAWIGLTLARHIPSQSPAVLGQGHEEGIH
ncbi:MAG: FUSC family protein [Candidatus Acidiferrum sp.]